MRRRAGRPQLKRDPLGAGRPEIDMSRINWRRVLLGGIVADVVWGALYAAAHPLVERHNSSGRPLLPLTPFAGAGAGVRVALVLNGILGFALVWQYAVIRPRFGPGVKTAATAGIALWLVTSWVHATWVLFSGVPAGALLAPLSANLLIVVAAAIAGARFYRE